MKLNTFVIALSIISLFSCGFSKSAKIDVTSGLTSIGDGLTSSEVYLSLKDDKKITKTTFTYGEVFYVNFKNVDGFIKVNGNTFPGMELAVVSEKGDTAIYYKDMYADKVNGIAITPLFLYANITVAKPMNSGKKYKLYVNIWDKKGNGTFKSQMDFDVKANEHIKVKNSEAITYSDIYLFSKEDKTTLNNKIKFNQTYYLIFEGLEGFTVKNDKMSVGLSMQATTADGNVILENQDLLGDGEYDAALVKEQISANFIFKDNTFKSPIACEFVVYDKKSEAKISANVSLDVK